MRCLLFCCFFIFSIVTSGQRYELKTLGIIKDAKNTPTLKKYGKYYYGIINQARSKMGWTIKMEKIKFSNKLVAYDEQINLYKETEIEGGREEFGPFSSSLRVINDKLYYIRYNYTESTGIEISAAETDTTFLKPGAFKKIITIDQKNIGIFKLMNLYSSHHMVIKVSPDKSKFLFLWIPGVNDSFFFVVTDNNLNKLNSQSVSIQNATDLSLDNCIVDNYGNFFMGYRYERKRKHYSGLVTFIDGITKEVPFSLNEAMPHDVYVSNGVTDDYIRVYGTYSKDQYYITGAFSCFIDKKSLSIKNLVQKPVPADMIDRFEKDWYAKTKKNDYGIYPQISFETIDLDDDNIIMAGDIIRYQSNGASPSRTVYGPSLLLFFSKSDINISRLPKREAISSGNNFHLHKWGDKVILLYPDLAENISKTLDEGKVTHFTSLKDNDIVAAVVKADGTIIRKILNPNSSGAFSFDPSFAESITDDSILMELSKDKMGLTSIRTTSQYYLIKILDE